MVSGRGRFAILVIMGFAVFTAIQANGGERSWWLNVFFNVNGEWRPGHEIDGWAARRYDTREECARRKAFAETECRKAPLDYPAVWICSPDGPLKEPPPRLQGTYCWDVSSDR